MKKKLTGYVNIRVLMKKDVKYFNGHFIQVKLKF